MNALSGFDVVKHGVTMAERAALARPPRSGVSECRRRAPRRSASSSAVAQSIVRSVGEANIVRRRSRPRSSFLWPLNPSGRRSSASFRLARRSSATAVRTRARGARRRFAPAGARRDHARAPATPARSRATVTCFLTSSSDRAGDTTPRASSVLRPDLPHGRMLGNSLVEQRLREGRFVALVVTVAPIADEVDQEVALELVPVRPREARRLDAGLHIVGVDVNDGNLEAAGETARVRRAVGFLRRRGEAELIVGDDVDGAAGLVARQPRQIERLGHHALAGEGGVAVNQDRQRHVGVEVRPPRLADSGAGRARHADHHGIHRLEVAGVRRDRDDDVLARAVADARTCARVILDVAGPSEVDRGTRRDASPDP